MANIDNYNTNITFQFKEETKSKNFNHLLAGIIPQAIYRGGDLQIYSGDNSMVEITPYISWKNANSDYSIAVKISTGNNVLISPSEINNLIIMKYLWIDDVIQNYPDYYAVPSGTQIESDLVFGEVVYSGTAIVGFDYTNKSISPFA